MRPGDEPKTRGNEMNSTNKTAIAIVTEKLLSFSDYAKGIDLVDETRNGFIVLSPVDDYGNYSSQFIILDDELPLSSFKPFELMSQALSQYNQLTNSKAELHRI